MEERTARDAYWWLWISPLLTVFTFVVAGGVFNIAALSDLPKEQGTRARLFYSLAVVISSLWHLVLLYRVRHKTSEFVRWHGRQALLLAGMRTAVPLAFILAFGFDFGFGPALAAIPILIVIWFVGTLLGQRQAARGTCSLMRWFGRADAQPARVNELVDIIRFSHNLTKRREALATLSKLGMVEPL